MQIIGSVNGNTMKLRGVLNHNILDLGEAHRAADGFWYFSDCYYELPSIAVWAVAAYLYKLNNTKITTNKEAV